MKKQKPGSKSRKLIEAAEKSQTPQTLLPGDYVRLIGGEEIPDEFGVIEWDEGISPLGEHFYVVQVDPKCIHDEDDDGAREVTQDQIQFIRRGKGTFTGKQSAGVKRVRDYLQAHGQDQKN